MKPITLIVWSIGLALQLLLLAALVLRGTVRRFPFFTLLIAFYVLRAALLFALSGHISAHAYASLYDFSSLADDCLQFVVAGEFAVALLRGREAASPSRPLFSAAVLAALLILAGALAWMLPTHGPAPVDRASAAASLFFILLFAAALSLRARGALLRLFVGFAAYSLVALAAEIARSFAALHRSAPAFETAAYAQSLAWLGAVVYWLIALDRSPALPPASAKPFSESRVTGAEASSYRDPGLPGSRSEGGRTNTERRLRAS